MFKEASVLVKRQLLQQWAKLILMIIGKERV